MRDLLGRPAPEVGPALLGSRLRSTIGGASVEVVVTEVEAYTSDDPASHSYRGRTSRNASMFGSPGTLYVYRSYGIHWCMNVTTGPAGEASALLLRAGVPVFGDEVIRRRRGRDVHLTDGPGKLCQALAVTGEFDGIDLLDPAAPCRLLPGTPQRWEAGPRIGITKATERPWRWVVTGPVSLPAPDE